MLVYGDAEVRLDLADAWRALGRLVSRRGGSLDEGLDPVRGLVVAAGQLEQAAHDALAPGAPSDADPAVARAHAVTEVLARWLVERVRSPSWVPPASERQRLAALLAGALPPVPARLKVPEGFAFYGLRPETYVRAAWRWAGERRPGGRRVLVLGVRSIGTTLAAVVTAALRETGLDVECHTIRPTGHPFDREASVSSWRLDPGRPVLLVDEGPGLSGSSLAAVVRAVHAAGLRPDGVTLLPGHAGEPGPMSPAWVREIWRDTPRVTVEDEGVAPELVGALEREKERGEGAAEALGFRGGVGAWAGTGSGGGTAASARGPPGRRLPWSSLDPVDAPEPAVPPPCRRFARPWHWLAAGPVRARAKLGGLASVLHEGELTTVAEVLAAGLERRSRLGFGPPVLAVAAGYVVLGAADADDDSPAEPFRPGWLDGLPSPCCPPPVAAWAHGPATWQSRLPHPSALASYLAATAGSPLPPADWAEAVERASLLLERNAAKVLSPRALRRLLARRPGPPAFPGPAATDYDLAPYHWLRGSAGASWKVGGRGAAVWDHTAVGPQPLAWSLASGLVEGTLRADDAWTSLARRDAGSGGGAGELASGIATRVEPAELSWWMGAYAAFRLGLAMLCHESCGGEEAVRAGASAEHYAAALRNAARSST